MGFSGSDGENISSDDTTALTRRLLKTSRPKKQSLPGDKRKKPVLYASDDDDAPRAEALSQQRKANQPSIPEVSRPSAASLDGSDSSSCYSSSEDDVIAQKIAKLMGTKPKPNPNTKGARKQRPRAPVPTRETKKRPALPPSSDESASCSVGNDEEGGSVRRSRFAREAAAKPPPPCVEIADPGTDGDDEIISRICRVPRLVTKSSVEPPVDPGIDGDDESSVDTATLLRRVQQRSAAAALKRKNHDDSSCDSNSSLLQPKLRTATVRAASVHETAPFADENRPPAPPNHVMQKEPEGETWDDALSVLDDGDGDSENTEELTRRMRGLPPKDAQHQPPPMQDFVLPDQQSSSSSEDEAEAIPEGPPPAIMVQYHPSPSVHASTPNLGDRPLPAARAPTAIANPYLQNVIVSPKQRNPQPATHPTDTVSARPATAFNPYAQPNPPTHQPQTTTPVVLHEGLRKPSPRFMSPQQTLAQPGNRKGFDDDIHDSEDEDGAAFGFAPTVTAAVERRKRDSVASFVPNAANGFPPFQREPRTERRKSVRHEDHRRGDSQYDDDVQSVPTHPDWSHQKSTMPETASYQQFQEDEYDDQLFPPQEPQTNDFAMTTYAANSHFKEPQRLFQAPPPAAYNHAEQGFGAFQQRNETGYQDQSSPIEMHGNTQSHLPYPPEHRNVQPVPQGWTQQNQSFQQHNNGMAPQPAHFSQASLHDDRLGYGQQAEPDFTLETAAHCEVDYTQFQPSAVPAPPQRKPRIRDANKRAPRSRKGGWKRRKKKGSVAAPSDRRRQRGGARATAQAAAAGDDPHLRSIGGAQISF